MAPSPACPAPTLRESGGNNRPWTRARARRPVRPRSQSELPPRAGRQCALVNQLRGRRVLDRLAERLEQHDVGFGAAAVDAPGEDFTDLARHEVGWERALFLRHQEIARLL